MLKSAKFMILKLLENTFMSQKMNLFIFTLTPGKTLSQILIMTPLPKAEGN